MTLKMNDSSKTTQPVFSLAAQYVKDLSFENKNIPFFVKHPPQSPATNIQFHVSAQPKEPDQFEVTLKVDLRADTEKNPIYLLELLYAGLFVLKGIDQKTQDILLNIECPKILFPAARHMIIALTHESSFPPITLPPSVDFAALYAKQKNAVSS